MCMQMTLAFYTRRTASQISMMLSLKTEIARRKRIGKSDNPETPLKKGKEPTSIVKHAKYLVFKLISTCCGISI